MSCHKRSSLSFLFVYWEIILHGETSMFQPPSPLRSLHLQWDRPRFSSWISQLSNHASDTSSQSIVCWPWISSCEREYCIDSIFINVAPKRSDLVVFLTALIFNHFDHRQRWQKLNLSEITYHKHRNTIMPLRLQTALIEIESIWDYIPQTYTRTSRITKDYV